MRDSRISVNTFTALTNWKANIIRFQTDKSGSLFTQISNQAADLKTM